MTHATGPFENDFVVEMIFPEIFPDEHNNILVTPRKTRAA
jgi:hypothetical protein